MHCTHCGQPVGTGSRFCLHCGAPVPASAAEVPFTAQTTNQTASRTTASDGAQSGAQTGAYPPPPPPPPVRPALSRPRSGRMIAGVCAAFSRAYGWDVTLIRILLVVATLLTAVGFGVLAYVIAWIVIPEEPQLPPYQGR